MAINEVSELVIIVLFSCFEVFDLELGYIVSIFKSILSSFFFSFFFLQCERFSIKYTMHRFWFWMFMFEQRSFVCVQLLL